MPKNEEPPLGSQPDKLTRLYGEFALPEGGFDPTLPSDRASFIRFVWRFYESYRREMPWRDLTSPYWVFVSEVMLQQTQVPRVIAKFPHFVNHFSDFNALAHAALGDVIAAWDGLGYNRRAKFLHRSARIIVEEYGGVLPSDIGSLQELPGIGPNTAGSIAAFAYNQPVVFIETNIRRVFLTFFFQNIEVPIHDREILPLIEDTLCKENPREWYWALMDLGVVLAKGKTNANRKSVHYTKQSKFEESDRQLRGKILHLLAQRGEVVAEDIPKYTGFSPERVQTVLKRLGEEGLIAHPPAGADGRITFPE